MLGRPDAAILWYQKAKISQQQPADYDALLGDCFTDLGWDEHARKAYETAANFRPDLPEGWLGLCRLSLLTGDTEAARKLYARKAGAFAGSKAAKEMEALIEFFARNYPRAEQLYMELSAEDADGGDKPGSYGMVNYNSALARIKMEQDGVESSRIWLEKCAATQTRRADDPSNSDMLYTLAAAESISGNLDASLNNLRAAISNGWVDHRSLRLDPRFDGIRTHPSFITILEDLTARAARLGRHQPADNVASK